jgi:hypothetical protein
MPTLPPIDPAEGTVPEGVDVDAIRRIQERNYRTSLKVWWARDFGYLALLDPYTGEVYEVERAHKNVPRWMTWRAMEEKNRRAAHRSQTSGSSGGTPWRGSSP